MPTVDAEALSLKLAKMRVSPWGLFIPQALIIWPTTGLYRISMFIGDGSHLP